MKLPPEEAARHMFHASRPGWPDLVRPGDIVVAGRNFGLGSSRPVAQLFVTLGVSALIAEQYNSLFLRNALNYGLPAITLPRVREFVAEGDLIALDVENGAFTNRTREQETRVAPFPDFLLDILRSGGLINQLRNGGYLRAPVTKE
ncbi:3-isopropylmalate dehydratase [Streptomyces misionensis]|uniref:LeuD/DmdB family oxidoreductase small subunit n=1 Tax=Streptomyces misionensis TaxID=67331 RepID=UPI00340E5B37